MKHLIILSLLVTGSCFAQQNQEQENDATKPDQKRPSWSQGLPERPSSVKPAATVNDFKVDKQPLPTATDERNLEITELPKVEIQLENTQPMIEFEVEVEPIQPTAISRREALEQYYNNDKETAVVENEVNPLIAQYKWTLLKTTPIEVPDSFAENTTLKLKIFINAKGDVTRVSEAEMNIPSRVFKSAERSILKWKFQPPAEIGISEEISRTFSIDIQTEA